MGKSSQEITEGNRIKLKKKSISIRGKVFFAFLCFVIFLIALLWVFQIVFLDDFYKILKKQQLQRAGEVVADNIDHTQLNGLIEQFKYQNDISVMILTQQGNLVTTNEDSFPGNVIQRLIGNDWQYYWLETAQSGGKWFKPFSTNDGREQPLGYDERNFRGPAPAPKSSRIENLLYAQLVPTEQGSTYMVLLSTMVSPVDATTETLTNQLIIITIILLICAVLISYLISRWVSRPIEDTNIAARALAKGNYTIPKTSKGYREIDELNETLHKAAQELDKVNRLQRELIANISHDLRTPLTMIGGYAEVMRDIPGEINEENMQVIIDETQRLSTLVSAIMDYSKLQAENQLEESIFNITKSIEDMLQRYQSFIQKNAYTIVFDYDQKVFTKADEMRIGQVLYNLINNAISYAGEDKTVLVTQQLIDKNQVKIAVTDYGAGIAPEELSSIWDRYYRASFHKRATIGTGLGLAIVKSILEMHGVEYGVQSEVGKGSTFWFALPVVEEAKEV